MRTLHAYEFRTLLEARRRSLLARPNATKEVTEVDAALERLASGQFGICLRCRAEIDRGRLKNDPLAELCGDCREE